MENKVTIQINNIESKIVDILPVPVIMDISSKTSYYIAGAQFSQYAKSGQWDGTKKLFSQKNQSFPTGLLNRVVKSLISFGYKIEFEDLRVKPVSKKPIKLKGIKLRDYQEDCINELSKKSRGIIQVGTGGGKCFRKGTPILMYNGTIKQVQDIVPGDLVMGPDSKPRTVGEVHTGVEQLYKVQYKRGSSYYVTKDHILTGKITNMGGNKRVTTGDGKKYKSGDIVDISVEDWFNSSSTFKHVFKGFSSKVTTFGSDDKKLPLYPYALGLWLGDGNKNGMAITTMDKEVSDYWYTLANEQKMGVRVYKKPDNAASTYFIHVNKGQPNYYTNILRDIGVYENKHIPQMYKVSSYKNRCELLAGIIDTDGYAHKNYIELVQKLKVLADDICFLARSLGFTTNVAKKYVKLQSGIVQEYFRIFICGDFSDIPLKVPRRLPKDKFKYNKEGRLFGVTITPDNVERYYGFSVLEEDKHFLLGDFTVVHNSMLTAGLIGKLNVRSLVIVPTSGLLYQTAEVLSKVTGKKIGMIGDSLKDIRDITVSTFQSLVESEDTKKRKYDAEKGRWSTVDAKKISIRSDLADYLASVECVVVDEAHHVSASSIQQILLNCPNAYYRYGCSATPFHDNDEDVLIEAACGRLLKVYSASFLIKEGWLSKPTIHLIPFKQEKGKSGKKYAELYNEKIVNNNKRNNLLLGIISKRADMGDSVLVSVRYLEHGDILYKELEKRYGKDVVFVNSKMPTKELNETLQKLSNKEIKIVIGTSLVNEGVNMPSLNTLVLAGTPKSKIATMQLVGRVLRKTDTKSTVDVYDIQDYNAKYFTSASVERLHIYTSEPEFILKEEKINV